MTEYKVVSYREPILSALFFAASNVDEERFTEFLNEYAREGWRVVAMEREQRRTMLYAKRESFIVILER